MTLHVTPAGLLALGAGTPAPLARRSGDGPGEWPEPGPATGPDELLALAARAAERASAPYSRFRVGAAALDAAGGVHLGCNVESASYTMTSHAEANAIAAAQLAGAPAIVAIAVVCLDAADRAPSAWPCGLCRQLLSEYAPVATVYIPGAARSVAALLPDAFGLTPAS